MESSCIVRDISPESTTVRAMKTKLQEEVVVSTSALSVPIPGLEDEYLMDV